MADSSILTLGTARSLLVDSSACETTRDHVFLGVACEDGEGEGVLSSVTRFHPSFRKESEHLKHRAHAPWRQLTIFEQDQVSAGRYTTIQGELETSS